MTEASSIWETSRISTPLPLSSLCRWVSPSLNITRQNRQPVAIFSAPVVTYSDLVLDRPSVHVGESLIASVIVTNTSERDADEIVQLYVHQRHGSASRPVRELKGFQRIHLKAGASRTVEFTIGPAELRYWNASVRDFVLDSSTFDLWVGGDSTAELTTTFTTKDE